MADSGCEDTVPSASLTCKMPEESDASMRARLFTSLSQSFPHSQLFKALHGEADINLGGDNFEDDDDDSLYGDHLSNSCFASLRMDRRDSDDFDDDLRSLEWLHSEDLLKNIGGEKLDKEDDGEEQKENEDIKPDINLLQANAGQPPTSLPYLPQKHVNSKPPYSFSCLIFMAVENSPQKRLPVKDIYNWILTQFPYFQNAPTGWKNSVRHNLSLNKCFKKVDKDKGQSIGKGSLWCIDPAYRPNLLQALRKTPYHPYHQLQMTSAAPQNYAQFQSLPGLGRSVLPLTQRPIPNTVSPHLFPFLSRRLAQTPLDVDNEMKDVAQTLVSLKSSHSKDSPGSSPGGDTGPTWRNCKPSYSYNSKHRPSSPVTITDHPYTDHAYSSTRLLEDDIPSTSSSSSIDEEYDFGSDADEECESDFQSEMEWDSDGKDEVDGELPPTKRSKSETGDAKNSVSSHKSKGNASSRPDVDEDEQKKIHEGASALLNLAGLIMNNRCSSGTKDNSEKSKSNDELKKKKKKKRKKLNEKSSPEQSKSKKIRKSMKAKVSKPVEEKKVERRRGVAKRKNAGSNGKYDNDDFTSTFKMSKANDNSKRLTPVKHKESNESLLSSGDRKGNKKALTNGKGVVKKNIRKKLPLSKSFGTNKKMNANKNEQLTKRPKGKNNNTTTHNNNNKIDKKVPKSTLAAKRKKKNSDLSSNNNNNNVASKGDSQSTVRNINTTNINNNNELKCKNPGEDLTAESNDKETRGRPKENGSVLHVEEPSDNSANNFATVAGKKEQPLNPSGDAPSLPKPGVQIKSNISSQDSESIAENGHIENTTENPLLKAVSLSAPSAAAAHQSHHFTRFSKKKAATS